MPEEGKADVGKTPEVEEIKPDASGKYPETVSWKQYVSTKETIGGKLEAERGKVANLEEQLKKAPNAEEFAKIKVELETMKTKLTEKDGELAKIKEAITTELRKNLVTKGLTEERVKTMTDSEMKVALEVLGTKKPAPDLGGGGGSGKLEGLPMELARQAYSQPSKK